MFYKSTEVVVKYGLVDYKKNYQATTLFTLNPNSPGFSASKSYNAVQHGELRGIWRWTDLIGEEIGDAKIKKKYTIQYWVY